MARNKQPKSNSAKPARLMSDTERGGMIDALRCKRGDPTQYSPPKEGIDRTLALYAICNMKLSAGAKAVGGRLIWHANHSSGRCDPGIGRLVKETCLCRQTVINALNELREAGIFTRERRTNGRGNASNAYHINWALLCGEARTAEERSGSAVNKPGGWSKDLDHPSTETCTTLVQGSGPELLNRTLEENSCPERARTPSRAALDFQNGSGKREQETNPGVKQKTLLLPITGTKAPKPPRREKPIHPVTAIHRDLKANLPPDRYAWVVEFVSEADEQAAVVRERRQPGSGWAFLYTCAQQAQYAAKTEPRRATA